MADMTDVAMYAAAKRYQNSVKRLFEIDPQTKKCFAEGSPTKDQEVYDRFVEFNKAGVRLSDVLEQFEGTEA